jgi:DNA gyrase inhibitor GyrI
MTADRTTSGLPATSATDGVVDPWSLSTSGGFLIRQARRPALRGLSRPLPAKLTVASLREGREQLAQLAATHQLQVVERPLFVLDADPSTDPRETWSWRTLLPIGGRLRKDELPEDVTVARTDGGTYVNTTTPRGLPDLDRVYRYFFEQYLPRYKHRLTRPCIFHRVLDGIEGDDPAALTVAVFFPVILSLEPVASAVTSGKGADS